MNKFIIISYLLSIGLTLYYDPHFIILAFTLHLWILTIAWQKPKEIKHKPMNEILEEYLEAKTKK